MLQMSDRSHNCHWSSKCCKSHTSSDAYAKPHDRIVEIEGKIGAGLIEEVIQVAHGEDKLVETMLENKV